MKLRVPLQILFGISVATFVFLAVGRTEFQRDLSFENYGPTGLTALKTLLQRSGYRVRNINNSSSADMSNALVLAVADSSEPDEMVKQLRKLGASSAGVVVLDDSNALSSESRAQARIIPIEHQFRNDTLQIPMGYGGNRTALEESEALTTSIWRDSNDESVMDYAVTGKTRFVYVHDVFPFMNQFIDQADSARFVLGAMRLASESKVVYFLNDYTQPGLISALGPGAETAWRQLIVLTVCVIATLGIRFGAPRSATVRHAGMRDFVDGLKTWLSRARGPRAGLTVVLEQWQQAIAQQHRVTLETVRADLPKYLNEDQLELYRRVRHLVDTVEDPRLAVEAARMVQAEMSSRLSGTTRRLKHR